MAIKKLLPALFDIGDADDGEVFRVSSGRLTKTGSGMVFKDNGRMGIGTASPDRILDVNGGTSSYLMQLHNTTAGGEFLEMIGDAGNPVWQFQSGGTGGEGLIKGYNDNVQKVQIAADTDHPTYFLASNVGIGTAAPNADLHVYEGSSGGTVSSNSNIVAIESNTNNGLQFLNPSANNANINFGDNNANEIGFIQYQHATDKMNFRAGGTTIMSLVGGNVGIGTTAPDVNLHVKSSTNTAIARIEGNTAGTAIGELQLEGYRTTADNGVLGRILVNNHNADIDVAKIEVWKDSSSTHDLGSFYFYTRPTGGSLTSRMVIKHDGKVGIGT
ncbi:MAG: hypothetical protein QF535_11505, partial [Anaerolineales bacterium]|nr:hypothetical protein [Anaerolineales bacterium]